MVSEESARLRALRSYRILDTPEEPNFDRITQLAAAIFDKPVSTLSLADVDRHWFKSRHGVDATEIPRGMSFCDQTIQGDEVFVVHDALLDTRFAASPFVVGSPHFRFYAGAPLVAAGGTRIGSLCVLDTEPHTAFSEREARILTDLASTAVELLEARSRQIDLADVTDKVAHLARHDPLTGLPNRRFLVECVEREAASAGDADSLSALYIDLDGFKDVNDRYGHSLGDVLLQQVAQRLQTNLRAGEISARLGGDEFIVLHKSTNGRTGQSSTELANFLIRTVAAPYHIDGHVLSMGASIGIATAPLKALSLDRLVRDADFALYRAKAEGRARWVHFNPELECDRVGALAAA